MRPLAAFGLVVVATLVAPLVIASSWVTARIDDRQEYVDTVAPLADDAEVRRLLADAAAEGAVAAVEEHVPFGLPDALTDLARAAATEVVESPYFPEFWRQANEDLHRDVLAILEDPDAKGEGRLTVDASPLLAQVLLVVGEKGVPISLLPEIPLNVPVVPEAKVVEAGPSYRLAHDVARILPVIWAALVLLAVVAAAGWRGRVRTAGFALLGVALAAVFVLLAADPATDLVVDRAEVAQQGLARILIDALAESLTPYVRGFLLAAPVGALLAAVSWWPRRAEPSYERDDWAPTSGY